MHERRDHDLAHLAVGLSLFIQDVGHLEPRAHVGREIGIHRKLGLKLPTVHERYAVRLPCAAEALRVARD